MRVGLGWPHWPGCPEGQGASQCFLKRAVPRPGPQAQSHLHCCGRRHCFDFGHHFQRRQPGRWQYHSVALPVERFILIFGMVLVLLYYIASLM